MKTDSQCIQGQFPGGMPHRSVIVNNSATGAFIQKNQNSRILLQRNNNGNAFKIQPNRLNLADSGVPLPKGVLQKMESVFDTDFSNVRIHTGGYQAESIGAMAFTTGNDIYFAQGQYNPHSLHGQRLIGHELTHVVQQRSGRVRNVFNGGVTVVNDPGLEAEAERISLITIQAYVSNIIQLKGKEGDLLAPTGTVKCEAKLISNNGTIYDKGPFEGFNGDHHNPPVQAKKELIDKVTQIEPWGILNCAEVGALEKALNKNSNAYIEQYQNSNEKHIRPTQKEYDIDLKKSNEDLLEQLVFSPWKLFTPRGSIEKAFPLCRHCEVWLEPVQGTKAEGKREIVEGDKKITQDCIISSKNEYKIRTDFIKSFIIPGKIA